MQNGIPLTDEMQLQLAERYGGVEAWGNQMMAPHYSAAWAWAGNTPFKWGKQVGSHLGGTRNPLVVHWPDRIRSRRGALRTPFHARHRHRPDDPRDRGHPDADPHRRDRAAADARVHVRRTRSPTRAAPERHTQQYFETIGNRAMYKDGWWLSMKTAAHPVGAHARGAQAVYPGRLESRRRPHRALLPARRLHPGQGPRRRASREGRRSCKDLFWQEAEKYNVLPLMAPLAAFFGIVPPLPTRSPSTSFAGMSKTSSRA